MTTSNRDYVAQMLELLKAGLLHFVSGQMKAEYGRR